MKQLILILLCFMLTPLAVMAEGEASQVPLADPYILLENGKYYAYGTHDANGIRCYSSDDLRTWKDEGLSLSKTNTTEQQWFWAPEVYHVNGHYIMYFSANDATAIESIDNGQRTMDEGVWYTIDGRMLSGKPTTKGIYVNNGRKVIIK